MTIKQDPGMHRRRVRLELRKAREQAEMTQQQVADALDWSLSKLIRIEAGSVGISITDLKALLDFYGVTDEETTKSLIRATRDSRGRSWWHEYREEIRPQYAQLLAYESAATVIRTYHPTVIPALLQIPPYTETVRAQNVKSVDSLRLLVQLVGERQAIFANVEALDASFIVDEAALRRQIGGAATMRDQLLHLKQLDSQVNIKISVLPFSAGAHQSLNGPLVLLKFEGGSVIFLEGARGDSISKEDEGLIAEYQGIFDHLIDMTLPPSEGIALLDTLIAEYSAVAEVQGA